MNRVCCFAAMPFLRLPALAPAMPACLQNFSSHEVQAFMRRSSKMSNCSMYFFSQPGVSFYTASHETNNAWTETLSLSKPEFAGKWLNFL
jgi:hypothetical protein